MSDVWYVKLANGDVHKVTLDQIDQAFDGGRIDANVLVRPEGSEEWRTLAELAGLDSPPVAPPPAAAYVPPAASMPPRRSYVPPAASMPPRSYAPPAPYARSYAPEPVSTGALSADFDGSDMPFRRSRKGWIVAALGVAAAAGFVGVSAMRSSGSTADTESTAAAKPAPVVAPAEPAPAPPTPAPAAGSLAGAQSSNDSALTPRFTEQQRQKLVETDKQHEGKAKAKSAGHGTGGPRPKSTGFTNSGSKFDPLNSAI